MHNVDFIQKVSSKMKGQEKRNLEFRKKKRKKEGEVKLRILFSSVIKLINIMSSKHTKDEKILELFNTYAVVRTEYNPFSIMKHCNLGSRFFLVGGNKKGRAKEAKPTTCPIQAL